MKTSDIRRAIDASLSGLKLSPEERRAIFERAMREEPSAPPPRHIARNLLLAALIALLTLAIVVPAVGGEIRRSEIEIEEDSVQLNAERTRDTPNSFPETAFPATAIATWGEEFCELLSSLGAQVLLPRWMPDGYQFESLNKDLLEFGKLDAWYEDTGGDLLLINVKILGGDSQAWAYSIESLPGTEETWALGGIEYIYSQNKGSCAVSWMEGNCAVTISAPIDREAMRRMVESIYE